MLSTITKQWDHFWFEPIPAYSVAAFRILFGLFLFIYFIVWSPHVALFFSNEGIYSPLLVPDIAPPPIIAYGLFGLFLCAIVSLILGYRTRLTAPLTFGLLLYHFFLNIAVKASSAERLILVFLFLLCFVDSGVVWSVKKSHQPPFVRAWLPRLLTIHISLFYFSTGLHKALAPDWQTGAILKGIMTSIWGTETAFWAVQQNIPDFIYNWLAASVIGFELVCGFLFFVRSLSIRWGEDHQITIPHVQYLAFAAALFFHLSIWLLMDIPQFLVLPTAYVLYLPPREVKALIHRAGQLLVLH